MNAHPRAAFAAILLVAAATAHGATRYVTDELRISVRTGAGNQYRIVEVIDSGTRLETLQTSGEWTEVRTPEDETGWVRSQYLSEQPIAAARLETVRDELQSARERVAELEQTLARVRSERDEARERVQSLGAEIDELTARLDDAESGLALHDENQRLKKRVDELGQRVERLQAEAAGQADRVRREWFLIGAGVLFGGMLFGIIVTRIPWRRRRDRMF